MYSIGNALHNSFFNLNLFILIGGQLLYNIVLVLPYIIMNPPRVYMCSLSWTPLPSPSPYHPSGSSQCTSPKHPVSCIKPGLGIVSYMILYMFQCHSPKSSHPLPLPQSPKDCSIHLCLFCCLAYRVIVTIIWLLLRDPPHCPVWGITKISNIAVRWIILNKWCIFSMSVCKREKLTLGNIIHFLQCN